jgi:hypothetical protein
MPSEFKIISNKIIERETERKKGNTSFGFRRLLMVSCMYLV